MTLLCVVHLSPIYGHVIQVNELSILTFVNWRWNDSFLVSVADGCNHQMTIYKRLKKTWLWTIHRHTTKQHQETPFHIMAHVIKNGKTNLQQEAHIHQPTAWPVPHACAQPFHTGSGSHGQLYRPYWGSSAWQNRRVNGRGKPVSQRPACCRGEWKALLEASAPHPGRGLAYVCPLL